MLVGVAVLLFAGSIMSLYAALDGGGSRRVAKERLARFAVIEQKSVLTRTAEAVEGKVDQVVRRRGGGLFSAEELRRAGVGMELSAFLVVLGCGSLAAFAVGLVLLGSAWMGVLLAVLVPVGAKAYVRWRHGRVVRRFADQLPQTLQLMAASLRAGHSLPRVLDSVSREVDVPMASELSRVVNEARIGRDLVVSLEEVAERMECVDFRWVAGAIAAQRETGGNLNELLEQVAETIRERQHVRMQVMALSAEGRLSAVILMLLPVGIGGYYALVAGEQMTTFVDSWVGKLLLLGSLAAYVLGGLWMRSVVRIEF